MSKMITKLMAVALIAVAVPSYASIATAAPISGAFAINNATPSTVENVRWGWRGGWGWGRGWGWAGVGAGLAAGALIGGALAAPYYSGYYGTPYYYASPYYAEPYYVVDQGYYTEPVGGGYYGGGYYGGGAYYGGAYARSGGGDVNYCMRRYRTYDARTGTFMGNDGRRHPCP
jgi:BA14K-like protein